MSVKLHWFLPTTVDSRTVVPFGPDGHGRAPTIDYLAQIARAADQLGYEGVLTPTGTWCEDAWLVTAARGAWHDAAEGQDRCRSPQRLGRRQGREHGRRLRAHTSRAVLSALVG